jgi:hypothetical protein
MNQIKRRRLRVVVLGAAIVVLFGILPVTSLALIRIREPDHRDPGLYVVAACSGISLLAAIITGVVGSKRGKGFWNYFFAGFLGALIGLGAGLGVVLRRRFR